MDHRYQLTALPTLYLSVRGTPNEGKRRDNQLLASSAIRLINRNPIVASLVQTTHRFSVTPVFPIPPRGSFGSIEAKARLISPSNVAIKPRYDRSSLPIADRRLWPIRPSSPDCVKSERTRYKSDGSASVCSRDMTGSGSVIGRSTVDVVENGKCLEDKPCSVKGRSCKRADSVGGLGASSVSSALLSVETGTVSLGGGWLSPTAPL